MTALDIPPINATMNGLATLCIGTGFVMIRTGRKNAHRACMMTAAVFSALFLVGYLTYHALRHGQTTPFGGTGAIAKVYYSMLISHIFLAMTIVVLVPRTFYLAIKGDFVRHRAWAKFTFPIWFYVSITGVLVYFFLYVWWPSPLL